MEPLCLKVLVYNSEGTLDDQRAFFIPFVRNNYLDNTINYCYLEIHPSERKKQ
jgi:hypothetical protein